MNKPGDLPMAAPRARNESHHAVVGSALPHESAHLHVAGSAPYTDDLPELAGTLHAALGLSPVAHGVIESIDLDLIRKQPGVVDVFSAKHIPGPNECGSLIKDDPILAGEAGDTLRYLGQPVFAVIASNREDARRAAAMARKAIRVRVLPPILTPEAAHAAQQYVVPPMHLSRGDARKAIDSAPHQLKTVFDVGGQEQFYLEGQISYAVPTEDRGMKVYCSTQHPSEMQHLVAHALHRPAHAVHVECRRMGGGFGGKESQSAIFACVAAVAATRLSRPVKLRLDRDDDFLVTGRRHCFHYEAEVGYDDSGRILGAELTMVSRAGHSADLSGPVMTRAICHFDNAYWLPHVDIHGFSGKTNTQSNTAFRGFGGPQGAIAIESLLDSVARALGQDPLAVRRANFYGIDSNNVTPYGQVVDDNIVAELVAQLEQEADYTPRRAAVAAFNARSPVLKKGLALTPLKFGISFNVTHLNQAGALVHVYTDGSVLVNHGGTEMGQGLNTKVAQVVAHELGLPLQSVRCTATDTQKVANTSATAASTGSDLNGKAAQDAARQLRERIAAFAAQRWGGAAADVVFARGRVQVAGQTMPFAEVVNAAYLARVQLWSDGFYATPGLSWDRTTMQGRPFHYFAYGAAVSEVLVDTLSGEWKLLRADSAARRRQFAQPGRRHRPGRRRLHPGHGLVDDGRTGLASGRRLGQGRLAHHPRAQHLQDPDRQRLPGAVQHQAVRSPQRAGQHPPQQGGGRAAAAAAVLGVLCDPRCGVVGGWSSCRPAVAGAGHQRIHPARHHRGAAGRCGSGSLMSKLASAALRWMAAARPAIVVEVQGARGSVPREDGTRMLVAADEVIGTIGGGHLELKAIADARAALARGIGVQEGWRQHVALGPSLGQCCGGALDLVFTPLTAATPAQWPAPAPRFTLQLYGAGHVGRAIVRLLEGIDCRVQWIDERESEFPGGTLAPHIDKVCVEPVQAEVAVAPPGAFYLVLTHSHDLDMAITQAILQRADFGYFGLIGSKTKRARFEHRLLERGFGAGLLQRITCPIGVPGIEGKEPEVIAVAVVGQLLQVASGGHNRLS